MGLGLVLSGGGTRCVVQLAVARCLQEWKLQPTAYAGSSAGALVACMLANGQHPDAIMEQVKELSILRMLKPQLNMQGLMDIEGVLKPFTSSLPATFDGFTAKVIIAATNLRTGKGELFSTGKVLSPLLASCCMTVVFAPVRIGADVYIDAGVTNNFPANALWGQCRYLLGIHTNPVDQQFVGTSVKNILERTFLLTINQNVLANKALCHRLLEPDFLKSIKVFDFKRVGEIYEKTLAWMEPQMPQLAEEIKQVTK